MLMETLNQRWLFLFAVYGGIALGFMYDTIRIIRLSIQAGSFATALFDFLFWILGSLMVFGILYVACRGEIKIFVLLGIACGVLFYLAGMSKLIMHTFQALQKAVHWILKRLSNTRLAGFMKK